MPCGVAKAGAVADAQRADLQSRCEHPWDDRASPDRMVSPKKMPNLVIDDDDLDNVIAYILSLRDRK
jgi:hypothetical protein